MPHSRKRRRPAARLTAGAAAVLAAALAIPTVVLPVAASAAAPAHRAASAPPVPVLHWRPCDHRFQCATARVPLDYSRPDGHTISIAMLRHLADNPGRRSDILFANGGGPAEQIEGFVSEFGAIPAGLRANFTIVTFDPRGFGFSTAIRCFPSTAAENKFLAKLPPFPVGPRQDAAWVRTFAGFDARCARRGGPLLAHDSTADVARDMNLLREAVGAPILNYVGLSYGTGLGAVYANLFPTTTGRMVLDGNLDPVAWTSGGALPMAMRRGADLATAAVLRDFLDLCGGATTSACAFSAGSPTATRAKWHTLLHRLRAHPVSVGSPPRTFTYADTLTDVPLGTVSQWQAGAGLLQQLWTASSDGNTRATRDKGVAGASTSLEGQLTHHHAARAAANVGVYTGLDQSYAVICADSGDPRAPSAYAAVARIGYARSGGYGLFYAWQEEVCARWPAAAGQDRYAGPWNRRTTSPILVIGNTGDPATPYQGSVAMAHDLARARLLTVHGYGHTEFANPSTCAEHAEVRYLTTGALPPAGTVCQQNGTPFPAPSRQRPAN